MPDSTVLIVVLVAAAALDASPLVRIPIGLVAAIGALAQHESTALCGLAAAVGIAAGRTATGLLARRTAGPGDVPPMLLLQRTALRQQLTTTPTPGRVTFAIAAAPGVPRNLLFPLLGQLRLPLWPAILGTVFGKTPILVITTTLFALLGRLGNGSSDPADSAVVLGVAAVVLFVVRSINAVDWEHRRATGKWRARESATNRTTAFFGMPGAPGAAGSHARAHENHHGGDDEDVIEGEVLGEEHEDDQASSGSIGRSSDSDTDS